MSVTCKHFNIIYISLSECKQIDMIKLLVSVTCARVIHLPRRISHSVTYSLKE